MGMEMSQWFDMWSLEDSQERCEMQVPRLQGSIKLLEEVLPRPVGSTSEQIPSIPVLLELCRNDNVVAVQNGEHLQRLMRSLRFNVQ